jgi:HipA-like protein
MARRTSHDRLRVFLNSRLVGLLRRETSGAISFQYDRSWLEWDSALPASLSLPLREQAYLGAPVLAVFENLLPDNDTLRRQIAARAHAEGTDAYSLLQVAIGRITEKDQQMTVEFSVLNASSKTIELLPPQIQLAGTSKEKHKKTVKADPVPIKDYTMTIRRLPPGARADGVVVFDRPSFTESREQMLLQVAQAEGVDQPVLVPVAFVAPEGGSR